MSGASPSPEFSRELIALLPRLRRYARILTRDAGSADDLVQDTIERAWSRHAQWRAGTDLRAWLFSIMHNRRVDTVRAERAQVSDVTIEPPDARDWRPVRFEPIDLQRAFERLREDHRQVLMLVAVEEMSYEAAAQALDVPIGTVMSRLARARQRLRDELEGVTGPAIADPGTGPRLKRIK